MATTKAKLATGAWLVEWVESERGWGQRPDGCYYYATERKAKSDTARIVTKMRKAEAEIYHGATPDEYSYPLEPRFVQVSDKLAKELKKESRVYRDRPEKGRNDAD